MELKSACKTGTPPGQSFKIKKKKGGGVNNTVQVEHVFSFTTDDKLENISHLR